MADQGNASRWGSSKLPSVLPSSSPQNPSCDIGIAATAQACPTPSLLRPPCAGAPPIAMSLLGTAAGATTSEDWGSSAPLLTISSTRSAPSQQPSPSNACRVTAKQWDTVAVWSWTAQCETCAICKSSLASACVDCQVRVGGSCGNSGAAAGAGAGIDGVGAGVVSQGSHVGNGGAATPTAFTSTGWGSITPPPSSQQQQQQHTIFTQQQQKQRRVLQGTEDRCVVAWGVCGHVFHHHCVSRWLIQRHMCPVCGRGWELYKLTSNE